MRPTAARSSRRRRASTGSGRRASRACCTSVRAEMQADGARVSTISHGAASATRLSSTSTGGGRPCQAPAPRSLCRPVRPPVRGRRVPCRGLVGDGRAPGQDRAADCRGTAHPAAPRGHRLSTRRSSTAAGESPPTSKIDAPAEHKEALGFPAPATGRSATNPDVILLALAAVMSPACGSSRSPRRSTLSYVSGQAWCCCSTAWISPDSVHVSPGASRHSTCPAMHR